MHRGDINIYIDDDSNDSGAIVSLMNKGARYKRSRIEIKGGKGAIRISVRAKDLTALIASMGSAIKQLSIISGTEDFVASETGSDKNKRGLG